MKEIHYNAEVWIWNSIDEKFYDQSFHADGDSLDDIKKYIKLCAKCGYFDMVKGDVLMLKNVVKTITEVKPIKNITVKL